MAQGNGEILVNVTAEREDTGIVRDLKAEDFRIKIGQTFQKLTSFQLKDEPISVGILIDVSGSIGRGNQSKNPRLELFVEGVKLFINSGNNANEYFVNGFNTETYSVVGRTESLSAARQGLEKLERTKTLGNTSFYDAVNVGLNEISSAKHRKRALIVVSDGSDNSSKYTFNDVSRALKSSDVLLYSVSFNGGGFSSIVNQQGFAFLDQLTALSGGKSLYVKRTDEISTTFEKIASELRSQYIIGFVPNEQKTGKWNKLKIELDLPESASRKNGKIVVRYRKGIVY